MAVVRSLKGLANSFKGVTERHAKGFEKGLKRAGLLLQAASMEIVPVDKGNLRATAFTRADGTGFKCVVKVGYTAAYAIYVHENLDALHGAAFNAAYAEQIAKGQEHTRGPNQQAKFLEKPAREKRAEMKAEILRGLKGR